MPPKVNWPAPVCLSLAEFAVGVLQMNECKNNILAHRSRFLYEMNSLMKPQRKNGLKDQFLVDHVDERWSSVSSGRCGKS